jgi:hypothetical protein
MGLPLQERITILFVGFLVMSGEVNSPVKDSGFTLLKFRVQRTFLQMC